MSFAQKEESRAEGEPVALYYFRYGSGSGSFYACTDSEHEISAPGSIAGEAVEYTPTTIMRKNITASGTLDKATIEISVPRDHPITDKFRIFPPSVVVSCVIRQGHLGELSNDYPPVWVGRVVGFSFEGSVAILALEPFSTSMRRSGLRRTYQYTCPHVLYAAGTCNADESAATTAVTIDGVVGADQLTLPAAWFGAIDINKYLTGTVKWTTDEGNDEVRMILNIVGARDVTMDGPATGLTGGNSVQIALGCNRQNGVPGVGDANGDCFNLHVETGTGDPNSKNFGGQPWIPVTNPISVSSSIY